MKRFKQDRVRFLADRILDRLVEAVNSLRQNNAGQEEAKSDTSTTNALKDFYPSAHGGGGRPAAKPSQTSSFDRPPYKPSAAYKSKKALPKKALKKATNKPPVLKDVILLPSPHTDEVPCGTFRESLFTRNFVASATPIEDMSEKDLRSLFDDLFKEKLENVFDPIKYEFTRAIGNKIVSVNTPHGQFTGNVLKYLSKQGDHPIYLLICLIYLLNLFMYLFIYRYIFLNIY